MAAQQVTCRELEVLEVERGLALLRGAVRLGESVEKLLQQVAVARGRFVERRLLDRLARLFAGRGALAGEAVGRQVEQPVRVRLALDEIEQLAGVRPLRVARVGVIGEASRGLAQLGEPAREVGTLAELEHEVAAGRAQRLVDAGEHPAQPAGAVRREQAEPLGIVVRAERGERRVERLAADHGRLRLVQLAEARVEPRREGIRLQQAVAEAVDGGDPRAVELAREIVSPPLDESGADAGAQLARRLARVRDHEDRVDVEPALADRAHEPLDQHRRLAGPGAGRDEDLALRLDRRELLLVHARPTRQIGHRSHQLGHSPPLGSCRTSPSRILPASCVASAFAPSTCDQNSSSST